METRKTPEDAVLKKENPPHPDAKYRGKEAVVEFKVGETKMQITIQVDPRDPKDWGTNAVTLYVAPIIDRSSIENLGYLVKLSWQISGPLSYALQEALKKIDPELVKPY